MLQHRRVALLCLLPTAALAQTPGQATITEPDGDAYVNLAECNGSTADTLTIAWQVGNGGVAPTTVPAGTTVNLTLSTDSACPPGSSSVVWKPGAPLDAGQSASGGYPTTGSSLTVATVLTQLGLNGCASQQTAIYACASMSVSGTTYSATGKITLDTQLPPAPVLASVSPGDSALIVSYSPGTPGTSAPATSDHYVAQATGPDGVAHSSNSTTNSSGTRIGGLVNGVTYDVVVFAYNVAGNQSAASNTMSGTPEPVTDFWQAYKDAGGREKGGCGAGPAGEPSAILALLASLLARRRRRP